MGASMLKLLFTLSYALFSAASFGDSKPDSIANQHAERKLAFEKVPAFVHVDCGSADDGTMHISSGNTDKDGLSLTSFPTGTRICYALKPEGAKINTLTKRSAEE